MFRILITTLGLAVLAAMSAHAQSLGAGDYELCSVYRPDGSFAGYDSACLERQRAAIRRYSGHRGRGGSYGHGAGSGGYAAAPYGHVPTSCPIWANNGYGYSSTITSGPGFNVRYGTFDAPVNGSPCFPSPNIFLPGFP
jgi:hypothetical protein